MLNLNALFVRRDLDTWRDDHTLIAARVLSQTASELIAGFADRLKDTSLKDGLLAPAAYIRRAVEPEIVAVIEPVATQLVEAANRALADIVDHSAQWSREAHVDVAPASGLEAFGDVASGVAPIVGGGMIAAAIPSLAIIKTGGLLGTGLFATTVISVPIMVVGGTTAAVAVSMGVLNAARLRDKTEARLWRKIAAHVDALLIRGTKTHPSVLEQLASRYAEAADRAKRIW